MPKYICVDEKYLAELDVLTNNLECLQAKYNSCLASQKDGVATKHQVRELEYEVSKAELALTSFRIDNISNNQINF